MRYVFGFGSMISIKLCENRAKSQEYYIFLSWYAYINTQHKHTNIPISNANDNAWSMNLTTSISYRHYINCWSKTNIFRLSHALYLCYFSKMVLCRNRKCILSSQIKVKCMIGFSYNSIWNLVYQLLISAFWALQYLRFSISIDL